jgi:general secretion pathway protein G
MGLVMKKHLHQKGFTLIELLVVMAILALLAALVGPRLFTKVDEGKQKAAQTQIGLFEQALDIFRLDVGRYPTTEEGLKALREKPSDVENWNGPYLKKEIPKDPWNHDYVYTCPGEEGREYDIISYGQDGAPGGEGNNTDIVSWKDVASK